MDGVTMGAAGTMRIGFLSRPLTDWRVRCQLWCLAHSLARYNRMGPANIGLELELQLIDTDGKPAHGLAQIVLDELADLQETRVVAEIADWVLELNLSVQDLVGTPLSDMFA